MNCFWDSERYKWLGAPPSKPCPQQAVPLTEQPPTQQPPPQLLLLLAAPCTTAARTMHAASAGQLTHPRAKLAAMEAAAAAVAVAAAVRKTLERKH
eukprot:1159695-Pelagomonas_calceolata.AAC.5